MGSFEDLSVFQKAYGLSLEVHRASLGFPSVEQYALGDQVRRASKSVCANLAEGIGRGGHSPAELRRYVSMALGSSDEMRLWVLYCIDLGYVDAETGGRWRAGYAEVSRMLQGLYRSSND